MATLTRYGNPTAEMMKWVGQSSFLDPLFTPCSTMEFPANEDPAVAAELVQVKELVEKLATDEEMLTRYRQYDRSLIQHVSKFTFNDDKELTALYQDLVREIFNDVSPLVYKLKLHFQRPRPFQLAAIHSIPLFPYASFSAQSPAFPCLHSTVGYVLSYVIGNRIPTTYKYFKDLNSDISHSRLYLGLSLASDANAGHDIGEKIVAVPEFKIKYKL